MSMFDKLDQVVERYQTLTEKLADPSIYDRQKEFKKISSERASIEDVVICYKKYRQIIEDINEAKEMLKDSDEDMKELLFNEKASNLSGITFNYSGTAQSFNMTLTYKVNGKYRVDIPITARTRASGGWSGKALYITSPGIKLVQ